MEKVNKQEALARFQAAKQKKKECLSQLEKDMKQTYEEKTGKKAFEELHAGKAKHDARNLFAE